MNCVIRQCTSYPKYTVSDYESSSICVISRIKFQQYVLFSTYSIHGLIGEARFSCNIYETKNTDGKIRSKRC